MQNTNHAFSIEVAQVYGVECAIILQHIQYWISFNKRAKKNNHDGKTWMYQTIEEIHNHHPYFRLDKLKDILELLTTGKTRKMKEKKFEPVLMKGNFNKIKFDQTIWYAFVDEDKWISIIDSGDLHNGKCLSPHSESGESHIRKCVSPLPIPESKTDSQPDPKKDNVPTMPSSKEIKNYKVYLTPEQRKLHDRLVKYQPEHGDKLKSDDVCAWFLKLKYSTEEVEKAFKVYQQRARKGSLNGREAENMGGYMVWAMKNKKEPENEDMRFNREFAKKMCEKYSFLEMTKNYVKVQFGNVSENVMLNLPRNTFSSQLENFINSAEFNCYV